MVLAKLKARSLLFNRPADCTKYTYDALDHLTVESWYSGAFTTTTLQRTNTYVYDLRDNLTDVNEGTGNVRSTFTYDLQDRPTDTTQVIPQASGAITFTYRTTYSYFADNQVQSRFASINGTLDSALTYTYDGIGRLTDEKQTLNPSGSGNIEAAFTYLPTGEIKTIQRKGGASFTNASLTTYTYDSLERETGISTTQGTFSYQYTYAYDAASRITREDNPSGSVTYTYYDNNEIKTATYSYRSAESFTWDENGNSTAAGVVIGAGDRLINDGTSTYEYDAEGNRTKKSTGTTITTYSWDQRDRLTGATTKTSGTTNKLVTVVYDAFNRRIAEYVGDGTTITRRDRYFWDGEEVHTIVNGTSTPTVTDRFLMGPGIDNTIADEKSGTINWTLTDIRGSVQQVLDSTGKNVTSKDYSTFGTKTDTGNPSVTDTVFAYTGREYDSDLGLQYNRERWYDPSTQRFINADPSQGDINTFRYALNQPTNGTDPSGLDILFNNWEQGLLATQALGKLLRQLADQYGHAHGNIYADPGNGQYRLRFDAQVQATINQALKDGCLTGAQARILGAAAHGTENITLGGLNNNGQILWAGNDSTSRGFLGNVIFGVTNGVGFFGGIAQTTFGILTFNPAAIWAGADFASTALLNGVTGREHRLMTQEILSPAIQAASTLNPYHSPLSAKEADDLVGLGFFVQGLRDFYRGMAPKSSPSVCSDISASSTAGEYVPDPIMENIAQGYGLAVETPFSGPAAVSPLQGLYGPFWRSEGPSVVSLIEQSGVVMGHPPTNIYSSNFPTVQAYPYPLPPGATGVQFYTPIQPEIVQGLGGPQAWWRGPLNTDVYSIPVIVTGKKP